MDAERSPLPRPPSDRTPPQPASAAYAPRPQPRQQEVHQPFKMEFAELVKKDVPSQAAPAPAPQAPPVQTERRHVSPDATVRVHGERSPAKEGSAPLSMLKTNPKKDKGPSEQNLSSLRDALSAVLVQKEEKKAPEAVLPAQAVPPVSQPQRVVPAPSQETKTAMPSPSMLPPPPSRAPLLDSPFTPPPPTEVPEDILKKVLAD